MLTDDASCQFMLDEHRDGLLVDMYAEEVGMQMTKTSGPEMMRQMMVTYKWMKH